MALQFNPTNVIFPQVVEVPSSWSPSFTSPTPEAFPAPPPIPSQMPAPTQGSPHLKMYGKVPTVQVMSKERYGAILREAQNSVSGALGIYNSSVSPVAQLESKQVYDDIHFLIQETYMDGTATNSWASAIARRLRSAAFTIDETNNCAYFEFKGNQVRVSVISKATNVDIGVYYLGYDGAIANLFPRVANVLGFEFSDKGVSLKVKDEDKILDKIHITTQFYDSLVLLGYDSYSFGSRFRTVDDIYKYFSNGTYFNREMFLAEYPVIEPGDTVMAGFHSYLSRSDYRNRYVPSAGQLTPWLVYLKKFRPSIINDYLAIKEQHKIKTMMDEKFNPTLVSSLTGLTGDELQEFMNVYRNKTYSTPDDFQRFILTSMPNTIANSIKYTLEYLKSPPAVVPTITVNKKTKVKRASDIAVPPPLTAIPRSAPVAPVGFTFNTGQASAQILSVDEANTLHDVGDLQIGTPISVPNLVSADISPYFNPMMVATAGFVNAQRTGTIWVGDAAGLIAATA